MQPALSLFEYECAIPQATFAFLRLPWLASTESSRSLPSVAARLELDVSCLAPLSPSFDPTRRTPPAASPALAAICALQPLFQARATDSDPPAL